MSFFGKNPAPAPTPASTGFLMDLRARIAHASLVQMIQQTVCETYQGPRGAHVDSVLGALGALAGFGCQMGLREALIATGQRTESQIFLEVKCADGNRYFFGDTLNQPLLEAPSSVLALICGGVNRAGSTKYPDAVAIVKHVADTIGTDRFGVSTAPADHRPSEAPLDSLKRFWPPLFTRIRGHYQDPRPEQRALNPLTLGWLFAEAAQNIIVMAKDVLDPTLAGHLALEAAVAMAQIDPALIPAPPAD